VAPAHGFNPCIIHPCQGLPGRNLDAKFVVYGDDDTFGVEIFALGCNQLKISYPSPMLSVE
jgi:hypothetical protein